MVCKCQVEIEGGLMGTAGCVTKLHRKVKHVIPAASTGTGVHHRMFAYKQIKTTKT